MTSNELKGVRFEYEACRTCENGWVDVALNQDGFHATITCKDSCEKVQKYHEGLPEIEVCDKCGTVLGTKE